MYVKTKASELTKEQQGERTHNLDMIDVLFSLLNEGLFPGKVAEQIQMSKSWLAEQRDKNDFVIMVMKD